MRENEVEEAVREMLAPGARASVRTHTPASRELASRSPCGPLTEVKDRNPGTRSVWQR